MSIIVVAGTNWGDEGKGWVVDYLAQDADVVVRFQGGANAGHTVVNELGTFRLHLVPSGVFHPKMINILGPGMLVDLEALAEEIAGLQAGGLEAANIRVSDRATICFPFHRDEDIWEEERLGQEKAFGSTRRGIAPGYGDRYLKKGIQIGELLYPDRLKDRLREVVAWKNLVAQGVYGKQDGISFESAWDWVNTFGERIRPLICDTTELSEEAVRQGETILFEAQLGALRDIYFGIYPYTTSSCTLAAFAPIGGGLLGQTADRIIGVTKAFSTCVGEGPFVTEMEEDEAHNLREMAHEYGAATGRPRRIGHFDAVASRYGAYLQGATELALTKLDSLAGCRRLRICTTYEVEGAQFTRFPLNHVLEKVRPIYNEVEGWSEDIGDIRRFDDLPEAARRYVLTIERLVGRPIRYVSVGASRECMIDRGARDT